MASRITNPFALLTIPEPPVNFPGPEEAAAAFVDTINSLQADGVSLTDDLLVRLNDARDELMIPERWVVLHAIFFPS